MKRYYYVDKQHKTAGPVPYEGLQSLLQQGAITIDTPIMPEGGTAWVNYREYAFPEAGGVALGAGTSSPNTPQKDTNARSNCVMWAAIILIGGCVGMGAISFVAILVLQQMGHEVKGVFADIKDKLLVAQAQSMLQSNSKAIDLLGSDIKLTEIPGKPFEHRNTIKMTTGTLKAVGSKGSGTLTFSYITLPRSENEGNFLVLDLEVNGTKHSLIAP